MSIAPGPVPNSWSTAPDQLPAGGVRFAPLAGLAAGGAAGLPPPSGIGAGAVGEVGASAGAGVPDGELGANELGAVELGADELGADELGADELGGGELGAAIAILAGGWLPKFSFDARAPLVRTTVR